MVAQIKSTHEMTSGINDLTAGDIRAFLEGVTDGMSVLVSVDPGDARERGIVTMRAQLSDITHDPGSYR